MNVLAQQWEKRGLVFAPDGQIPWMRSHAQVPTVVKVDTGTLRVFFGTRDDQNRTRTGYLDLKRQNPKQVLYVHDKPVLNLGSMGTFDDCGVMPSCVVEHQDEIWLYYTGWNVRNTVPYHNSIGVAASFDRGLTFERMFRGPIMDRTAEEPFFCSGPSVLIDAGVWRMWYLSCTDWRLVNGQPEALYHIKYAESGNGVEWRRTGHVCIDYKSKSEGGIVRPAILKRGDRYCMWYCYRSHHNYRVDVAASYRIGYAESPDGMLWNRMDDVVGLEPSLTGWDSLMVAYPNIYQDTNEEIMLYNGNGFGSTGFGIAAREWPDPRGADSP